MKKVKDFLHGLLEKEVEPVQWLLIFSSFIFLRSFVEQILALSKPLTPLETIMEFLHNFYFFGLSILFTWFMLALILRLKPQKLSHILIFSMFLIISPSFIDMVKTGGEIYWSFYLLSNPHDLWKQYLTVFGHLPSGIVYFGTKIVFVATVLLVAGVTWIISRKIWKTALAAIGTYSILFFLGAFPSLFYYVYLLFSPTGKISEVHSFDIASFLFFQDKIWGVVFSSFQYTLAYKLNYVYYLLTVGLLASLFFLGSRKKFQAVLLNLRLPQIIYHLGMFAIGMGLGLLQYRSNLRVDIFSVLAVIISGISVCLSWMASVVVNDLNDLEIDRISNAERPLPKKIFTPHEYRQLGIFFFFLAVLGGATIGLPFAVFLGVYQILAWIYSSRPFRLKKIPIIATFISALASVTILFLGFALVSDGQNIHTLSWRIVSLLLIAYTISLPIKDFKDIEGDKKDGILTVPVLFGEKKGRLIVAIGVFVSYVISVFFLNEMKLFFWAVFFGAASFLIINNSEIAPRKLPAWILSVVSVYFFILVWVVFV